MRPDRGEDKGLAYFKKSYIDSVRTRGLQFEELLGLIQLRLLL